MIYLNKLLKMTFTILKNPNHPDAILISNLLVTTESQNGKGYKILPYKYIYTFVNIFDGVNPFVMS